MAGIVIYDARWFTIPVIVVAAALISSFIVYALAAVVSQNTFVKIASAIGLNIFLFLSGISVSYYSDARSYKMWFGHRVNEPYACLARIATAPVEKEHVWKLRVQVVASGVDNKIATASGDAFLYVYKDRYPMLLHKGDSIWVPGKWQPIKNSGNPFEFDYATFCRRNGVFYQQFCSMNNIRLYATADPLAMPLADKCHDWCMQQLDRYMPGTKAKGLIQAMLLGDEVNLDEDLRQSYADTGIVHIIAISGGNVAIFFIVISFLLRWLRHKKYRWIRFAIALPLVWFYIVMAGAPPSAVRAAIMFTLLAFSVMLQKSNNSLNQLFATAFLLLFAQPAWLFSVGFQLSFVAVLSLILFYTPVYKWLSPVSKVAKCLWSTAAASIAAEVLVAPLVIYYFHTFPLLFLVANVAAYIFMTLALILGIVVIAVSFMSPVADCLGKCTECIVTAFDKIVSFLQHGNPESFHFLVLTGFELVVAFVAITCLSVFLIRKKKTALYAGLSACILLFSSFCIDEWQALHQQKLIVYNINKANYIEWINGKQFLVLKADTGITKKTDYAAKPAHIGFHAWHQGKAEKVDIVDVNGKNVLLLTDPVDTNLTFHADYLIINQNVLQSPAALKNVFSPSLIIVGNASPPNLLDRFITACTEAHIPVHATGRDGAFVLAH